MSFFNNAPDYDTQNVKETLEHSVKPKITQTSVYSMEPEGLYGTVYEDPRGTQNLKMSGIAALLLGVLLTIILGSIIYGQLKAASAFPQSVKDLASQSLDLPILTDFASMDDTTIFDTLSATNTVAQTSSDSSGETIYRLPDGVDALTLAGYSSEGFDTLDIDTLSTVLKTSWQISTSRGGENTIKLKYADFTSGSVDAAVRAGIAQQGFDVTTSTVMSSGLDTNGNTYSYGTIVIDSTTYYWRVAAITLTEVYANDELPEDSYYVGITISDTEFMTIDSSTGNATSSSSSV